MKDTIPVDFESSSAGLAMLKAYGFKATFGMAGAALLYMMLPPVDEHGRFNRREFVARLAAAGIGSSLFGDWGVDILANIDWLHAANHKAAVYLMVGAPFWWVSRAVALWFHNRSAKDIGQMIKDAKDTVQ